MCPYSNVSVSLFFPGSTERDFSGVSVSTRLLFRCLASFPRDPYFVFSFLATVSLIFVSYFFFLKKNFDFFVLSCEEMISSRFSLFLSSFFQFVSVSSRVKNVLFVGKRK